MLNIDPQLRRWLKAQAHPLQPVVLIGEAGLSEAVLQEIDRTLAHHQLIKIKVHNDDRALRETQLKTICERLDAAPVQHIGKVLVVYRPAPEE